jgi:hypothetical protein
VGVVMNVKKVRGENRIHPIELSESQLQICRVFYIEPEVYIKTLLEQIAKKRRWKWFFEQKENTK